LRRRFGFMGRRRRSALAAVYAFAREVDDAVDEIGLDGKDPVRARRISRRLAELF
jgi:phytoene/squalene synthetase